MKSPIPKIPWQITGNHWVTVPCIHPADASIHAIGAVHAGTRSAVEFAGGPDFLNGTEPALMRLTVSVNGTRVQLGSEGIAWERESGWIPTFNCRVGSLTIRGVICAPHGKSGDVQGFVISVGVENRGDSEADLRIGLEGILGHRHLRVRTPRACKDEHTAADVGDVIILEGADTATPMAIAIGADGVTEHSIDRDSASWTMETSIAVAAGATHETAFHIAVGSEQDGAAGALRSMRRRGSKALIASTRSTLREMEPATGSAAADRLIARHVFFAYFCSVARALDESHWYVVRSRMPWNGRGMTITDWEALMWVLPAIQLIDHGLAREILLRVCELHGYAPGSGVHYLDGSVFEPGFSLEGAGAYAIAVDAYIVQTSDDKIVEEPILADSLYGSQEDIEARRHPQHPLFSTEINPDGSVPDHPYTTHGNAVAALALDILRHTLDEKTSEKVQDPAAVRAALLRQLSQNPAGKSTFATSADLAGAFSTADYPSASLYWIPNYDLISRDDSSYRRTVKPLSAIEPEDLVVRCARMLGPSGAEAIEWMRRAPLNGGIAAEFVDADGVARANGGDAALSGLIAYTLWYAVNALGLKV